LTNQKNISGANLIIAQTYRCQPALSVLISSCYEYIKRW